MLAVVSPSNTSVGSDRNDVVLWNSKESELLRQVLCRVASFIAPPDIWDYDETSLLEVIAYCTTPVDTCHLSLKVKVWYHESLRDPHAFEVHAIA